MVSRKDIESIIEKSIESRENNEIIDEEKCSKPKIISTLPGDGRTTDSLTLNRRLDKVNERLRDTQEKYDKANKEFDKLDKETKSLIKKIDKNISDYNKEVKHIHNLTDKKGRDYWDDSATLAINNVTKTQAKGLKNAWKKLYDISHGDKVDKLMKNVKSLIDGEDIPLKKFVGNWGISDITNKLANASDKFVNIESIDVHPYEIRKAGGGLSKNVTDYSKVSKKRDDAEKKASNLSSDLDDLKGEAQNIKEKLQNSS